MLTFFYILPKSSRLDYSSSQELLLKSPTIRGTCPMEVEKRVVLAQRWPKINHNILEYTRTYSSIPSLGLFRDLPNTTKCCERKSGKKCTNKRQNRVGLSMWGQSGTTEAPPPTGVNASQAGAASMHHIATALQYTTVKKIPPHNAMDNTR